MKLNNTLDAYSKEPSVLTIGTFDGVHIGHQKIIKRLNAVAHEKGLKSVVLTFFPHPRMVLQKNSNIKLLNTIDERQQILSQLGLDHLVVKTFTKEFSNLSADEFVKDILVDKLNAKYIIIGYDHRFGKNRSADINDLKTFGEKYGFEVEEISSQDVEEVAVSSTKIRTALMHGDIATANSFLGYNYFITGKVVHGKKIGKSLGYPTANIEVTEDYKLIPKDGVYVIKGTIGDHQYGGMMNIGTNPTFGGTEKTIEVNFFDFDASIYDEVIKVEFLHHLRDEYNFESVSLLKSQLSEDEVNAKKFLKNHG